MTLNLIRNLEQNNQIYQTDQLEAEKNPLKTTRVFSVGELATEEECFSWDTVYYLYLRRESTKCFKAIHMVEIDNSNFSGVMDQMLTKLLKSR